MTAKQIRQAFLDFFESKQHQIVASAPIVVKNDPTLMFTNAGMNQFKDLFLGQAAVKYSRVADTQRCLRVSGKHNDLEEVGIDTYHHTMFEMLGNWSFGDPNNPDSGYFKAEAIAWSWELLTEVYKLPKSRLYVSVFEGDEKENLPKSVVALQEWQKLVPMAHIIFGNKKDNFWEMGETGPCGPCSEIHIDLRPDTERELVDGATLVNNDHPQVIEIWNNVFMMYNRLKDGTLVPLPAKHVDTGMGFERLVRAVQNKTSNYDTDVFMPMIDFIAAKSGIPYITHVDVSKDTPQAIAMRVMADHIRAICFAIADGQLPSNNKAGYVIRRILRRAVRYAYQYLNLKQPFLNRLVPILAAQFEGVFNELIAQQDFVQKVVLEEEVAFLRTLENGIQRFDKYTADLSTATISGDFAFELYDTFGFPIDLTELMAREKNLLVDMAGFENQLQKQKNRSRAATAVDTHDWVTIHPDEEVIFVGYDESESLTKILKYRKVSSKTAQQYQLVLNRTPFYAESGGQVGDTGVLIGKSQTIEITDTKKENGLIIHFVNQLPQNLSEKFTAKINTKQRIASQNNHSATHLLQAALKTVLGTHVNQKGSLVNAQQLRFDFSHFSKVSDEDILTIENMVNQKIRENIALKEERNVAYQQALDSGVTALFGEKYGDFVRIITFDDAYSKELCGGTHVAATGQIGLFKIISESAVSAGVRRIEAITGQASEAYIHQQNALIGQIKQLLKNPQDVSKALENILEENIKLKKDAEKLVLEKASHLKDSLKATAIHTKGINFIAQKINLPHTDAVKNLAYQLKDVVPNLVLVLATVIDNKPLLTVMVAENVVKEKGLHAGNMVKILAKEIDGGGGGQAFYATAGGKNAAGLAIALEKASNFL
ncbi:MAG: alanine--tRNA ligase [Sphingobacteriales bacterium]|nr:MAG: alanine--tRNA ligase [Sphingobacteriales bacterium]TAF78705.1 MAG: alanine--tRNA ligase [Sphingobacteriales bacterium]